MNHGGANFVDIRLPCGFSVEGRGGVMASRVLVVDDSYDERALTRKVLEREGFEVVEATDGQLALDAIEESEPDIVLLDLTMAGMGGLEVLTHLRRKGDVPVIILSARTEESERVLALEMGADDY